MKYTCMYVELLLHVHDMYVGNSNSLIARSSPLIHMINIPIHVPTEMPMQPLSSTTPFCSRIHDSSAP